MTATFYADATLAAERDVTLGEDAAHHARVRRLDVGESVRVTNGAGMIADARIQSLDKRAMQLAVDTVFTVTAPTPVTLCVPVGDRDRMLWLAEKATELQVTRWIPVRWERSRNVNPRGEGEAFEQKLRARSISALEQSAGAWLPKFEALVDGARLIETIREPGWLLDIGGEPLERDALRATRHATIALGPEGGLTATERDALLDGGWRAWRLGSTTLRFETAALAALATVRALTT